VPVRKACLKGAKRGFGSRSARLVEIPERRRLGQQAGSFQLDLFATEIPDEFQRRDTANPAPPSVPTPLHGDEPSVAHRDISDRSLGDETRTAVGASYWWAGHNANIKALYTRIAPRALARQNEFTVQLQIFYF